MKKQSIALVIALVCALTAVPATGCTGNTSEGGNPSSAEESTTAAPAETTNGTLPETSDTQNRLTDEQAKEAFNNYMIESLTELNSPIRRYWSYEKTEGDIAVFWFTVNNLNYPTRLDMNLVTGEAVASAYERKAGELNRIDDPGVSEYNFNAWDYIKTPSELTNDKKAKDMQSYLGMNINDVVKEFGDLEYKPDQKNTGWVNKNLMFDPYIKNKDAVEYIRIFDTEAYSLYGVIPGMSLKEAVTFAVFNGAGSMIPGDDGNIDGEGKLYYFEMADGNTLEILIKEDKVNYAGVIGKNIKSAFVTDL